MKIIDIAEKDSYIEAIKEAVFMLEQGGTVVFPTDTVYGLAANACEDHAVRMIYRIKKRPLQKSLPVLVRDLVWAKEVAFVPPKLEPILEKLWPGPITIVLPVKKIISKEVTQGQKTIALRVANHSFVDALLKAYGYPLATSSANISGNEGSNDPAVFIKDFEKEIFKPDIVFTAGKTSEVSSTIIDYSTIQPRILRVGSVKPAELSQILNTKL